jgi:hypothetical protein
MQNKKPVKHINQANLALSRAFQRLGYDPQKLTGKSLADMAVRLSIIAKKEPPWHQKYIHNVLVGNLPAGKELHAAIIKLLSTTVETPAGTSVIVIGNVEPGALVIADSRRCEYPPCNVIFVPKMPSQKYHCESCKKAMRKLRSSKKHAIIRKS